MNIREYLKTANRRTVDLAWALGVPAAVVSQWASGVRRVPLGRCVQIHHETNGSVRCDELRPDFPWRDIPMLFPDECHRLVAGLTAHHAGVAHADQ